MGQRQAVELANLCPNTIIEAHAAARGRVRTQPHQLQLRPVVQPSSPTPAFLYDR